MPEAGITRLLGPAVDPSRLRGVGCAELYLVVADPAAHHARALSAGAQRLSPLAPRVGRARLPLFDVRRSLYEREVTF